MWLSENNKHLIVLPSVRLTDTIDPVIAALDSYFEKAGLKANVTSGLREPADQLAIVKYYAKKRGIDKEFPRIATCDLLSKYMFNGGEDVVFEWQPAWSRLLNIGVIVNPPLAARVLFDYTKNGKNERGKIKNSSPHFKGTAFDIGGATGKPDISDELAIIKPAFESNSIRGWKNYLVERQNNCIHNDCEIPEPLA